MSSYVVTGVSRGIGWAFLNHLSDDPRNTVIGIVRNKPATDQRVVSELGGRSNITILEADLNRYGDLKRVAAETEVVTGGKLDYLVANAAYITSFDAFPGIGDLGQTPQELTDELHKLLDTNVLANIHLYNLFMPQILKGKAKKVVVISTGVADIDWTNDYELEGNALYGISKAAMNMVTSKFHAQYRKDGVLFLSICPGLVDSGHFNEPTAEDKAKLQILFEKFSRYSPDFKGLDDPASAVKAVMWVIENSSIEQGDGGRFLSHFKNKQWL
ncbi:hypothetical protein B0T17DRAFT_567445 [Bombardia bombarda]|uniref:NAD(P)-binding protein n=1 Tax=Bombardia bombarda TaxID=252184 RepID=A0AA39XNT5_9PEZI|nr:hypothetical protein B0T17DRAFT_567445 [Bombardia bombarda]